MEKRRNNVPADALERDLAIWHGLRDVEWKRKKNFQLGASLDKLRKSDIINIPEFSTVKRVWKQVDLARKRVGGWDTHYFYD